MAFYYEFKTKEELYDILTAIYDVEEKTALVLIENLINICHYTMLTLIII